MRFKNYNWLREIFSNIFEVVLNLFHKGKLLWYPIILLGVSNELLYITNCKSPKKFISDNNSFSLKIKFLEEKRPLGTVGSIKLIKKISSNFIIVNCDVISDVNLNQLMNFHKKKKIIPMINENNWRIF